jgi:hypothetical protein
MQQEENYDSDEKIDKATQAYKYLKPDCKMNVIRLQVIYLMFEFYYYLIKNRPNYNFDSSNRTVEMISYRYLIRDIVFRKKPIPLDWRDVFLTEEEMTEEEDKIIRQLMSKMIVFIIRPYEGKYLTIEIYMGSKISSYVPIICYITIRMKGNPKEITIRITHESFPNNEIHIKELMQKLDNMLNEAMILIIRNSIGVIDIEDITMNI